MPEPTQFENILSGYKPIWSCSVEKKGYSVSQVMFQSVYLSVLYSFIRLCSCMCVCVFDMHTELQFIHVRVRALPHLYETPSLCNVQSAPSLPPPLPEEAAAQGGEVE